MSPAGDQAACPAKGRDPSAAGLKADLAALAGMAWGGQQAMAVPARENASARDQEQSPAAGPAVVIPFPAPLPPPSPLLARLLWGKAVRRRFGVVRED